MKYYLLVDECIAVFTYIIQCNDLGEVISGREVQMGVRGEFLSNIFQREFLAREFLNEGGETYYGNRKIYCYTSISKYEYEKLILICNLYPSYHEYNELLKL